MGRSVEERKARAEDQASVEHQPYQILKNPCLFCHLFPVLWTEDLAPVQPEAPTRRPPCERLTDQPRSWLAVREHGTTGWVTAMTQAQP
ncbi:MAG: hypothetical protein ACPIOQ_85080 [Promethearchaeia archaeon]